MTQASKPPFFILGAVRSGTTLLRDLLRQHPNLDCPEETHFFRWAEPFGTKAYERNYARRVLFKKHRELDGVDNFDFFYNLQKGPDRKHLMNSYAELFLKAKQTPDIRWFDKTPQNVYGLLLLSGLYPSSRFIHIHRHPYNVVTSLKLGRMLGEQELRGAINFWKESLVIVQEYKKGFGDRLLEVGYEALVKDPQAIQGKILEFIDEKPFTLDLETKTVHEEKNRYLDHLDTAEIATINEQCGELMQIYGYDPIVD